MKFQPVVVVVALLGVFAVFVASIDTCTNGDCFLGCNPNNQSDITGFYSTEIKTCLCVRINKIVEDASAVERVGDIVPALKKHFCKLMCARSQSYVPSIDRGVTGFETDRDDKNIRCTCVTALNRGLWGHVFTRAIHHHLNKCNNKIAMFREKSRKCVLQNDFTGNCVLWSMRRFTPIC